MEMTALAEALSKLLFNKVCTGRAFSLMFSNDAYASSCKQLALKEKLISETKFSKRNRCTHTVRLYQLTRKGLKYVLDHNEVIDGLTTLREHMKRGLMILGPGDRGGEDKFQIARATTAVTMAALAGAAIPGENYILRGPGKHNPPCVEDIIRAELTPDEYEEIELFPGDGSGIVFHGVSAVKAQMNGPGQDAAQNDFRAGRYQGIIESQYRSVLTYVAPLFGMLWSKRVLQKEILAYRRWRKVKGTTPPAAYKRSGVCGLLLVNNPEQFANLYYDVDGVNNRDAFCFGGDFDHLYIIPVSKEGAKHLRWLMLINEDDESAQIKRLLLQQEQYTPNEIVTRAEPFPLRDRSGVRTAIGVTFDAKVLLAIERTARKSPDEVLAVLCYRWQESYYRRVLPDNVRLILIDSCGELNKITYL